MTSVCPSIHPSVCPQGGVPISHNALQHFPECHEAAGGYLGQVPPRGGTRVRYPSRGGTRTPPGGVPRSGGYLGQVPPRGVPGSGTPRGVPGPPGGGGGTRVRYPPRGGYPGQVPPGGYLGQVPPGGVPGSGTPGGVPGPPPGGVVPRSGTPPGGYPGRTTEGVLTTRRAVCLLRSRRRTFLLILTLKLSISHHLYLVKSRNCISLVASSVRTK